MRNEQHFLDAHHIIEALDVCRTFSNLVLKLQTHTHTMVNGFEYEFGSSGSLLLSSSGNSFVASFPVVRLRH